MDIRLYDVDGRSIFPKGSKTVSYLLLWDDAKAGKKFDSRCIEFQVTTELEMVDAILYAEELLEAHGEFVKQIKSGTAKTIKEVTQ